MIHKSLAETSAGTHRYLDEKLAEGIGEEGRRRGVSIGIDNPNFSVINRSPVHGT